VQADRHTAGGIDSFDQSRACVLRLSVAGGDICAPEAEMSLATVLVTGRAGSIWSHVTAELLRHGHGVRATDNLSTGSRDNLEAVGDDVEVIEGDIRSYERTHAATEGVDCVIHLAAPPPEPRFVQDPLTTNEVNVTGILSVVLAARDAGMQRVVMASPSSVYGRAQELPKTEGLVHSRPRPTSCRSWRRSSIAWG
jgi:nucleoside-diphosphate-sugar epimerase